MNRISTVAHTTLPWSNTNHRYLTCAHRWHIVFITNECMSMCDICEYVFRAGRWTVRGAGWLFNALAWGQPVIAIEPNAMFSTLCTPVTKQQDEYLSSLLFFHTNCNMFLQLFAFGTTPSPTFVKHDAATRYKASWYFSWNSERLWIRYRLMRFADTASRLLGGFGCRNADS